MCGAKEESGGIFFRFPLEKLGRQWHHYLRYRIQEIDQNGMFFPDRGFQIFEEYRTWLVFPHMWRLRMLGPSYHWYNFNLELDKFRSKSRVNSLYMRKNFEEKYCIATSTLVSSFFAFLKHIKVNKENRISKAASSTATTYCFYLFTLSTPKK